MPAGLLNIARNNHMPVPAAFFVECVSAGTLSLLRLEMIAGPSAPEPMAPAVPPAMRTFSSARLPWPDRLND
jgi:hypothetical protein